MQTYGGAMTQGPGGRVQRSINFDRDVLAWLQERGKRLERSVDWQLREMAREKMDAETRQEAAS
jgi:uncharacterized protein (DUF4415 family)